MLVEEVSAYSRFPDNRTDPQIFRTVSDKGFAQIRAKTQIGEIARSASSCSFCAIYIRFRAIENVH
jgi:hypothetical protein